MPLQHADKIGAAGRESSSVSRHFIRLPLRPYFSISLWTALAVALGAHSTRSTSSLPSPKTRQKGSDS